MKKRIIAALLILAAILSFGTTAFAAPEDTVDPTPSAQPAAVPLFPLQLGIENGIVEALQTYLIANGYVLEATGVYDANTEAVVKLYQASIGYEPTGIADVKTFERLGRVENFLAIAVSKLGTRYVSGGKGPNKFDCSGFVYWVLNQSGVKQAYMTSRVWPKSKTYTRISSMNDLVRGDILCFKGHMAIYLGNGKMIDASSSNHKVVIRENSILKSSYWKRNFVCGFRVF